MITLIVALWGTLMTWGLISVHQWGEEALDELYTHPEETT